MFSESYAMAQAPATPGAQQSPLTSMLVPMVVIFGIMYFMMIRPQRKRESDHKKFLDSLKKGDEVVTQAGIWGRVANVADQVVTLQVADNVKIRVSRSTVAGMQPASAQNAEAKG